MDYATEILKDPTYQSIVAEIEALEADRIYCRHGMAHIMDVCRLSWNLCLEDICMRQEVLQMRRKNSAYKIGTVATLRGEINQKDFSEEGAGFKRLAGASARNHLAMEFVEAEAEITNFPTEEAEAKRTNSPTEEADQNGLTVEFIETLRDRMFVVGLLHDIGRGVQYKTGEHHAQAGARLADEILTRLRYPQEWKEQAVKMIRDHCGRKSNISKAEAWSFLKQDASNDLYHRFHQNGIGGVSHSDAMEPTMGESSADDKNADCAYSPENVERLIAYYIQRADHLSRRCFCCKAADTCKWTLPERNQRFF